MRSLFDQCVNLFVLNALTLPLAATRPALAESIKGSAAPYASNLYREQAASVRRYGINIYDLYPGLKDPSENSPFLKVVEKNRKKPCEADSTFWAKENTACEIGSFKELGLPSSLKKGSVVWLFAPNHIHKVKIDSLRIIIPNDPSHSELSVFVSSDKPLPPYRGDYGLILEKEPPPQTYTQVKLPASARTQVLGIAKKEKAVTGGKRPSFGPLIKTRLGNFTYANCETNEGGDFNTSEILFFKEEAKGKWALLHRFRDQFTQVFADIDGDGIPEFATITGYKSVHFHKIFPKLEVLRSGTSGV